MTKRLRSTQLHQRVERTGLLGLAATLLQGLTDILTGTEPELSDEEIPIPAVSEFLRRLNEEVRNTLKNLNAED